LKTSFKIIVGLLIGLLFATSCSRKKATFINRNFHAVATEYNTLYNGSLAFEQGRNSLKQTYQDNYWELLPIERMEILEEIGLPGESKNQDFERAEEKAVKAIQKHSMNINGKENNPQIDEAYLLLGKARYFDQRFVPALQAFNYILHKYPSSDKINQAKVWREKTNIRLENDELAIKNLKRLLDQEDLKGQDLADATSMLAQAYINTKSLDSAITEIGIAARATKNDDERGRYRFIQGQLYNELGHKDSANIAFDKVIELNRKTPRIYLITAHLEKAKNFNYENGNKIAFLELLTDLEENRENRPYLDKIYHQIAGYHVANTSDSLAFTYYNKSLRTNSPDALLKAKNYEALGDMSFDNSDYQLAGAYFDSTMLNYKKDSKPFRIIKKKRDNLDDVINYEEIAKVNDSLLHLVSLNDTERLALIETYIESLKLQAEQEKAKEENAERDKGLATVNDPKGASAKNSFGNRAGLPGTSSAFYFYNPTTVAYGRSEFVKIWGNRIVEDNWRWSDKAKTRIKTQTVEPDVVEVTEEELYDTKYYLAQIPVDPKQIDSITKERNYAYYQLGLIYKEKFKEYQLAKEKLQQLLKNNPEERLILPAKYNLYKIYTLLEENGEAEIAKNEIINNYPESRYAAILTNPELAASQDENSPETIYESLYGKLITQEYQEIIGKCADYISRFEGDPITPKFELLKATATGRLYGFEAYKKAINYVALNYANTEEGRQAQNISSNVLPKLNNKRFLADSTGNNYKVLYQFNNTLKEDINKFHDTLKEVVEPIQYYNLSTSIDVYDLKTTFVVVHGLKSKQGALGFAQLLNDEDRGKIAKPFVAISSENYQIIQIHKNLDIYLKDQQ
jgi:tetratricopeptide (TPR) repeat protein